MEGLGFIIPILFGLGAVLFHHIRLRSDMTRLAAELDLHPRRSRPPWRLEAVGERERHRIRVRCSYKHREDEQPRRIVHIRVLAPTPFRYALHVTSAGLLHKTGLLNHSKDIPLGSLDFDRKILVRGQHEAGIVGILNAPCRGFILRLNALSDRFVLKGSRLELTLTRDASQLQPDIAVQIALDLCRRLARGGSIQDHLEEGLTQETSPGIRLRYLKLRVGYGVSTEQARACIAPLLNDSDAEIRLEAAVVLGGEALETVCEHLATFPLPWSPWVIQRLASCRDVRVLNVLRMSLQQPENASTAALGLARLGDRESVPKLVRLFHRLRDISDKVNVLEALGSLEGEAAQRLLRGIIGDDHAETRLRLSAIQVLGRCGSIDAVAWLLPFREAGPSALRKAATESIRHIQGRLGEANAGWLTMAESKMPDGSLVLVPDDGTGALSEPEGVPNHGHSPSDDHGCTPDEVRSDRQTLEIPTMGTRGQASHVS